MAEQVNRRWAVVKTHIDTEGNITGYLVESDAGDSQYLTAEEFKRLKETVAETGREGFKSQ